MIKELTLDQLDLSSLLQPGDTITWGQGCAEPLALTGKLIEQQQDLERLNIFSGLALSNTLSQLSNTQITSYGALGNNVKFAASDHFDMIPCNYSALTELITNRRIDIDVVFVQLSPRGKHGYSLGLCNDYLPAAMKAARLVIAEVNEHIPQSILDTPLDDSLIDIVVHSDLPPLQSPMHTIGDTERAIAQRIAPFIEDGAILQYGVGSLPSAILSALSQHQNLGIHSGMITDDIIPLIEAGAITNNTNRVNPGISIGAVAMGSTRLNRFLHQNPQIEMHPSSKTHSIKALAQLDRLVAINSALEVDLYGQVNAEMIGARYVGAVGGQVDFMHAASTHVRGLSIIALPSVTHNGKHSRIVQELNSPLLTTCKSDVDIIVTEQGVADLRGKTFSQRAQAIAQIAAPQFRDALEY